MPTTKRQTPISAKLKKLPPKKPKNTEQRTREYLTQAEVETLRQAACQHGGRHGHRDDTLILLMFRHGFRVSAVIALRWEQIDLKQGLLCASIKEWITSDASSVRY